MDHFYIYGLIFGLGSTLVCWSVLWILTKYHRGVLAVDLPNQRSLHSIPTPRGGGIVIAGTLVAATISLMFLTSGMETNLLAFGASALVLSILGWLDDQTGLKITTKLIVECLIGVIALWLIQPGAYIQVFSGKPIVVVPFMAISLSLVWIIWMTNVYNFMDGIDGFVASQTILSSTVIAGWLLFHGDVTISLLCLSLGGAGIGFLFFNWAPAKIFLGDAGSLTLGVVFALLVIYGVFVHQIPVTAFILVHGVCLLDATMTLVRRILSGEKWWEAHATHFYQRAVRTGVSHRRVSIIAVLLSGVLAILGTFEILSIGHGLIWLSLGLVLMLVMIKIVQIREDRLRAK